MAITNKKDVEDLATKDTQNPKNSAEELPKVHQIIRHISKQGKFFNDAWPVDAIDAYVGSYLNMGYEIKSTHYLGENPDGFGVLYILTLKEVI